MIPDVIEVQAALPLTANGKVNRKRLMSSRETRNTERSMSESLQFKAPFGNGWRGC